jgi:hypothetical protein
MWIWGGAALTFMMIADFFDDSNDWSDKLLKGKKWWWT